MKANNYIEVDHHQVYKKKQHVGGDVFLTRKIKNENRVISVLADGLGSGIKANVLATLTATMAVKFAKYETGIKKAAEIILQTLPVCSKRKIAYSTFTIIDIDHKGFTKIIEHDNPPYVLLRNGKAIEIEKEEFPIKSFNDKKTVLYYSSFMLEAEDRLLFFSDGVSQAGIGRPVSPLGWQHEHLISFIEQICDENPNISARDFSKLLVKEALHKDGDKAADDITCGSIYCRAPRKLLLVSGPPYEKASDYEYASITKNFDGKKIVAGGTSANIISRELGLPISINLSELKRNDGVPPSAVMEGIDLITEGTITLSKVIKVLENDEKADELANSVDKKMATMFLNSDIISILAGTKINEAHQDPNLPQDLEIRRNLLKRLSSVLTEKYNKEVLTTYI